MHQLQWNPRVGQQHIDYPGLVQRAGLAAQQQADIVIGDVIDPADGFADEGFDIRRVLADRIDQSVGGNLFRPVQGDRLTRRRRRGFDGLVAIALGQHQSVVQGL